MAFAPPPSQAPRLEHGRQGIALLLAPGAQWLQRGQQRIPPAIGQGLNPPAPNLALSDTQSRTDGQLYWITSHGFRMTGMPGFAPTHEPQDVWKMVSFVRHLPKLTDEERERLRAGLPREDEEPVAHAHTKKGE